jgi:hypothetical protein
MAINPPGEYQPITVPFGDRGWVLKLDPSLLQQGQYQLVRNMVSLQEGSIRTRNGYRALNTDPFLLIIEAGNVDYIHSIGYLITGADLSSNYRYIGGNQYIFRMDSNVPPGNYDLIADLNNTEFGKRWSMVGYRKNSSGYPYAYFATTSFMLKDPLTDNTTGALLGQANPAADAKQIQKWGIDAPPTPVIYVGANGGGLLDPVISTYNYVITRKNPFTGVESNPSIPMAVEIGDPVLTPMNPNSSISLLIDPYTCSLQYPDPSNTNVLFKDPQVYGKQTICLYRKGGSFSDGLYRFVRAFDSDDTGNPPTIPDFTGIFPWTDNVPDADIIDGRIVDFDNFCPVVSTTPVPIVADIIALDPVPGAPVKTFYVKLDVHQGFYPSHSTIRDILRIGSTVTVGSGELKERAIVRAFRDTSPNDTVVLYLQKTHTVPADPSIQPYEKLTCDANTNQPCRFSALAYDSLFLAGDEANPNILYKSKIGRPEYFPVINLTDGTPGNVEVGSPSNPIMNICEFNGSLISLNKARIYVVPVWGNQMGAPQETPAQRGLIASWAWCKGDNFLAYVAYDGVYIWSGSDSIKISEEIDALFKGEWITVDGENIAPMNLSDQIPEGEFLSPADRINMEYFRNQLLLAYQDINGGVQRLRWHELYRRWSLDSVSPTVMKLEAETGNLLFATADPANGDTIAHLNLDDVPATPTSTSTSDGWTSSQADGASIDWKLVTASYTLGSPTLQKQWGDIILELNNPADTVTVNMYYDYGAVDAVDVFTIAPATGRRRYTLPFNAGAAREAYGMTFMFTGSTKQPTTLYSMTFTALPLTSIMKGRAYDWDNLGYPHDKKLQQLSIEYDVGGSPVTLNLDTVSGIGGATETQAKQTFDLVSPAATFPTGPVRARTSFPINDGTIVKLARLRPTIPALEFKIWSYNFDFIQYPPDIVPWTEWSDLGYPCEKILRELLIQVDTGGVDATTSVQVDGVTAQTFKINSSTNDRHLILTMDSDIIGKKFRLVNVHGTGGKFQLFDYKFNWIPEPCEVIHWDSYEQAYGYNGFKWIKQIWIEYISCSGIDCYIYTDNKRLLLKQSLPRHPYRAIERFYLPPISMEGVLNKSKIYRKVIDSCDPCCGFKIYKDGTRVEWMPVGADMRQGYQQFAFFQDIPIVALGAQ